MLNLYVEKNVPSPIFFYIIAATKKKKIGGGRGGYIFPSSNSNCCVCIDGRLCVLQVIVTGYSVSWSVSHVIIHPGNRTSINPPPPL